MFYKAVVSSFYVIETPLRTKYYYNNIKYTYFTKYSNRYISESATPFINFVKYKHGGLYDNIPGSIRNE